MHAEFSSKILIEHMLHRKFSTYTMRIIFATAQCSIYTLAQYIWLPEEKKLHKSDLSEHLYLSGAVLYSWSIPAQPHAVIS